MNFDKCGECSRLLLDDRICKDCFPEGEKEISDTLSVKLSDQDLSYINEGVESSDHRPESTPVPETGTYQPPQPEFSLDENILSGVKEPEIEFYGQCKICEVPVGEDREELGFCDECYEHLCKMTGTFIAPSGGLKN